MYRSIFMVSYSVYFYGIETGQLGLCESVHFHWSENGPCQACQSVCFYGSETLVGSGWCQLVHICGPKVGRVKVYIFIGQKTGQVKLVSVVNPALNKSQLGQNCTKLVSTWSKHILTWSSLITSLSKTGVDFLWLNKPGFNLNRFG